MNYGIKQTVDIDDMIDKISMHQGERIDWVNKAKHSLFDALGNELYNNFRKDVQEKYDEMKNEKTVELELVIFGKEEYRHRIQELTNIIAHLDYKTQKDILRVMDSDTEPKSKEIKKKYI